MIYIILCIIIIALLIYNKKTIDRERKRYSDKFIQWKQQELNEIKDKANTDSRLEFEKWKGEYEIKIRKDAVKKSQSITIGKVTEHLLPFFPNFKYNPKDARFIGAPIDMIVFNGLNDNKDIEIVFIETKTGQSSMNSNERRVKEAIENKNVRWEIINPGDTNVQ